MSITPDCRPKQPMELYWVPRLGETHNLQLHLGHAVADNIVLLKLKVQHLPFCCRTPPLALLLTRGIKQGSDDLCFQSGDLRSSSCLSGHLWPQSFERLLLAGLRQKNSPHKGLLCRASELFCQSGCLSCLGWRGAPQTVYSGPHVCSCCH